MDSLALEYARKRKGFSKKHMAAVIGKCESSYSKKERGDVQFTDDEKSAIVRELGLTFQQTNAIFFDGNLPIR